MRLLNIYRDDYKEGCLKVEIDFWTAFFKNEILLIKEI